MKKALSLIMSFAILIAVMSASHVSASAGESQNPASSIAADEYFFAYAAPDRSEYQLTDEQLDLPTAELIDCILNYPYLVDLNISSSPDVDAYSILRESFNGLAELETREDAASEMAHKFAELAVSTAEEGRTAAVYLHTLLSVPAYYNDLSVTDASTYAKLSEQCGLFNKTDVDIAEVEQPPISVYTSPTVAFSANGFSYIKSNTVGATTSGMTIPLYTALSDYSSDEKESLAKDLAKRYGIDILGNATSMYNCHSYAWHQSSVNNTSWIVDVEIYMGDKHSMQLREASVGAIVVYLDRDKKPIHSAVVTSIDGDTIMCRSKWGANGLFEHSIENVPYLYDSNSVLVKFYSYSRSHDCTVRINSAATHTLTCTVCGWTLTEAHIENVHTGRCITCGLPGPFLVVISTLSESVEDINEQFN